MLERPSVSDSDIEGFLKRDYGLESPRVEFLPVGNDVNTAAYRVVNPDHDALYLKLRRGDFNVASVMVPYLLKQHGVNQVIAPIPTQSHQEWSAFNEYSIALYPFVKGRNAFQ